MSNKTCCQCRYMLHKDTFEVCTRIMANTAMFNEACKHFDPKVITNGDVIRQMSDGVLAFTVSRLILGGCPISKSKNIYDCEVSTDCVSCLKRWLNAPAEIDTESEE